MSQQTSYKVHGLDCSEEVAILERVIGGREGVLSLSCDVVNGRMSVEYDPDALTPDEIVSAVNATGMKAELWGKRTKGSDQTFWQQHGQLVLVAISGGLLATGFVVHWAIHGSFLDALVEMREEHSYPPLAIIFYVGSVLAGAWFVFPRAVQSARWLRPDMNLLMVIAVIGALVIGEWFEAATVAFLFAVALLLEHWSVERARNAIGALMDMSPTMARYVQEPDGEVLEKPVEEVPVDVTVLVRPGEKIPLDGVVTKGESKVNQAAITGESMPVAKSPGDEVFAGTINEDGAIEFRSTKAANDTTLAHIIHMVQEAQSRRAPSQQWVDQFAAWYTPAMLILAIILAVLPPLLGLGNWLDWGYRALVILVIACPCALVISTPVSIVSSLTAAARHGVLVKGGVYMEGVGRLRVLALDKTGTLTYGQPEVQRLVALNGHSARELLERAGALEAHSEHPLAQAIMRECKSEGIDTKPANGYQALRGRGGQGQIGGRMFWIGSHRLMHEKGQETPEIHAQTVELEDAGHTIVAVGNDQHVCGLISVADRVREDAQEAVRRLRSAGIDSVVMLTGDNEGTAKSIASVTGIDDWRAELLPEDKVKAVDSLVQNFQFVGMVGDGINDAPALAAASIGIAMGGMGTDAAIETADIVLMSDDLLKLSWLIRHSRRTLRNIKTNIAFALGLKALFIVLAIFGLASLWAAIAADTGATLVVVFNGLRLLRE